MDVRPTGAGGRPMRTFAYGRARRPHGQVRGPRSRGRARGPSTAGAQPRRDRAGRWRPREPSRWPARRRGARAPAHAEPRALPLALLLPRGPAQPERAFARPSTWREGRVAAGWGGRCSPHSQGERSGTAVAALAPARLLSPTAAPCRPRGLAVPEAVGFICSWVVWIFQLLMFQPFSLAQPHPETRDFSVCCTSGHPVRPPG